jgi:hypothetical protein
MNPKLPVEILELLEPLEAVTAYLLIRNDNLETMTAAIEIARIAYSEEFSPDWISLLACAAVPDPITPENISGIATSTAIRSAFDEARRKLLFDLKEGGYGNFDPIPATV